MTILKLLTTHSRNYPRILHRCNAAVVKQSLTTGRTAALRHCARPKRLAGLPSPACVLVRVNPTVLWCCPHQMCSCAATTEAD